MKTKKEIMLQNTADGIMAHNLVNGQPDGEIVRLFGTHILPTAFYGDTMAEAVREIGECNPGVRISVI